MWFLVSFLEERDNYRACASTAMFKTFLQAVETSKTCDRDFFMYVYLKECTSGIVCELVDATLVSQFTFGSVCLARAYACDCVLLGRV